MFKHGFALGALLGLGAAFVKDEHGVALKDAVYNFLTDELATGKQMINQGKRLQTKWTELNQQLPAVKASEAAVKDQVQAWQATSQDSLLKIKASLRHFNQQ